MNRKSLAIRVWIIVIAILTIFPTVALASQGVYDLGVLGSENAGWILSKSHRGSKTTVYKVDSTATQYQSSITSGFNCWGSYITDSTSSSSTSIIKSEATDPVLNNVALTSASYNGVTGHIYQWKITIYRDQFDPLTSNERINTIGHEVGHAFGLDDLGLRMNPNSIMKEALDDIVVTTPAPKDKKGMEVVTHVHTTHTWSGVYCTYCYGSQP